MRWLLVGCENGKMYRYNLGVLSINQLRRAKMAAMEKFKPGHKRRGQGVVQFGTPPAIYPVGEEWHESYIDDILMVETVGKDRTIHNAISKYILKNANINPMIFTTSFPANSVSRASGDEEFIMWNPLKSTSKDADIYAAYEWPETMAYCIRMKLYEANGKQG